MTQFLRTRVTAVGPDVPDLLEGGVLILFADGAPPELAEVSVLHSVVGEPTAEAPVAGVPIRVGAVEARLTGIGDLAWAKVRDIGHVVINFNGLAAPERPGELTATAVDGGELAAALQPGAEIIIGD
ncbi:PTS glucitol/sorbitol transporter subunit IIA [Aureimonas phyllosphaerae]|uniref:PTS system glucitol/sorbitol-specific IIA component n=1 Tax=Aureimonas phyllosphaerae TaxID=1166078 RepID=A0A7W6FU57_9HYPH|nr:PTS glucitol/sorbitol transporter subunit IIA [Aureimonas phyllosphaerae]MBB3935731.1 PTS system glucitol/sorbitol-specific IIA component [Aureimonas phyllosphaerae]MBB3959739.1 PTS system glucitol/sorbitol-specific IIA component [Aureimonas phyllosphaerae]SFF14414.1 PTS system, glucitol/sorbitol-specific IIA component [Aureimonas phyllosphaerae]